MTRTVTDLPPRIPIDRDELPLKRSLISQLLLQLLANNQLKAFAPLATREGCVNSISTLLGEIQRAARTPAELADILNARAKDLEKGNGTTRGITQLDFDKEISLIYSTYTELLDRSLFTEEDAEQLRALWVLRGMIDEHWVKAPWLANVQLLIIDGFFDFTPVQGEILRQLIPLLPQTIVNLNHDDSNPEIFTPFQETIGQLESIAKFDQVHSRDYIGHGRRPRRAARKPLQPADRRRMKFQTIRKRSCARFVISNAAIATPKSARSRAKSNVSC